MATPLWKKAFDAAESRAAPVLGEVLANPDVVEAMTIGIAVRKRAGEDFARFVRRGLHAFNVPAGTDVQKVSQQVAGIEREIRQLNRRLDELRGVDLSEEAT